MPPNRRAITFDAIVAGEWQNVTADYDLDALWNRRHIREGYAWVGVSAQRVGVNQLRAWSPTRYGLLDVTGAGLFVTDQLSYDIYADAARALPDLLGDLDVERVLAIGASQSAGRMTVYYSLRAAAGAAGFRRLRVHRRDRTDPRRHGADHPGAVRDRRDEPGDAAAGR